MQSKSLKFLEKSKIITVTVNKCNCLEKLEQVLNNHISMTKSLVDDLECLRIMELINDYKKYIKEIK